MPKKDIPIKKFLIIIDNPLKQAFMIYKNYIINKAALLI